MKGINYKLRNDMAVQLLEASGIAIIVITCIILHISVADLGGLWGL